jgi:hypothetical protein
VQEAKRTNAYTAANSDFIRDQQQQQTMIRQEQDQNLGQISQSLDTLHEMARKIDTELQEQVCERDVGSTARCDCHCYFMSRKLY